MQILRCVDRYSLKQAGSIKKLKPPLSGLRLRCGDYRVFFDQEAEGGMFITAILHRSEAYR